MKSSGIGGQAVLEGVMMKNKEEYAVAVRVPGKGIVVDKKTYRSMAEKYKVLKLPIIRGVVNFVDSMVIGTRTLAYSSSFFEEEDAVLENKDEKSNQIEKKETKKKNNEKSNKKAAEKEKAKESSEGFMMAVTICISILLAVGIFMLLPFFIGSLISKYIESSAVLALVEGVIRIIIFVGYIAVISQMNDIKRVFMYHGAEHKTINCIEHGYDLTVENVRHQSRQHKRCGTSFMLIVMVVSVIFFIFIKVDSIWMRALYRILLVPVIAGVSYEFIRLAGRSESKLVELLSKPGLLLQGLTTREPDDEMIEVAIKSVEAVFDWKEFLEENKEQWSKKEEVMVQEEPEISETAASCETNIQHSKESDRIVLDGVHTVDDEEDDDILKALDHYFDTPEARVLEENQNDKED